jgi:hypothetical protein
VYDAAWKEAVQVFFYDFLALFFPEAHEGINWRVKPRFLDKELSKIHPESEQGTRIVDKLVEVRRNDGDKALVLVHIEIQAQPDPVFERRMFEYHARIFAHHNRQVVSLAVLADTQPSWRPNRFGYELWGCRVRLDFPAVKLLDCRWEELEESRNPFAAVVQAHLRAQVTSKDSPVRMAWKKAVVTGLYEKGFGRKKIRTLFRFIDGLLELSRELDIQFQHDIAQFEAERNMPYITSIERIGIEKGLEQGRLAMARENVEQVLETRFGAVPASVHEKIQSLEDLDELREFHKSAIQAESLIAFELHVADRSHES